MDISSKIPQYNTNNIPITHTKMIPTLCDDKLFLIKNCFCDMVDRRKAFSLISSRDHDQRSSPSRLSGTPQAGFESAQNMSLGFDE